MSVIFRGAWMAFTKLLARLAGCRVVLGAHLVRNACSNSGATPRSRSTLDYVHVSEVIGNHDAMDVP